MLHMSMLRWRREERGFPPSSDGEGDASGTRGRRTTELVGDRMSSICTGGVNERVPVLAECSFLSLARGCRTSAVAGRVGCGPDRMRHRTGPARI